jgi:membrane protein YqaA with SNARE-associated domain
MQKILSRLRYPKLFLLFLSVLSGFLIYFDQNNFHFHELITKSGYIGIFLAGFFLAHGFTMGPAIAALLIISKTESLFPASLIATVGAIIGNSVFYSLLRVSYHRELAELSRLPFFTKLQKWANANTPQFVRAYFLPVFASIISATPLPDEFSVILVKASKEISATAFTIATAIVGIFGVTIILLLGRLL